MGNNEQIMKNIFDNFQKYSRPGETLVLNGEKVQYDYIRDNNHPDYAGTLHDRTTFEKSALICLVDKLSFSNSNEASVMTNCLNESLDDCENIYSGNSYGNLKPYESNLTLELKIINDLPVLRTNGMSSWENIKIR